MLHLWVHFIFGGVFYVFTAQLLSGYTKQNKIKIMQIAALHHNIMHATSQTD